MLFKYRVKTRSGEISQGTKEAQSEEAAVAWIRQQGWVPISLESDSTISIGASKSEPGRKKDEKKSLLQMELIPQGVKLMEKNVLFKQMSVMINSGITIGETLNVLNNQTENRTLSSALEGLRDLVSSGVTFAAAMARYPKIFTSLEIALVRAGEEGGVLDISMRRLADFVEAQYTLRKKVKTAMTYPTVVMVFVLAVLAILALVIVPMFRQAFSNLGLKELPL